MKQIQTLFGDISEIKRTNKETIRTYKQRLKDHIDYDCFKNQVMGIREKMKMIEASIADELGLEMSLIRNEITMLKEMMSDIAVNDLVEKGKVEIITDEFGIKYEPVIKVSFKKAKK